MRWSAGAVAPSPTLGSVRVPGRPVAVVGDAVTVISGPLTFVGSVLGLVQGRLAAGQGGLGGLQGLLGGLGATLGLLDPSVVQSQGGQPLALGVLDNLLGHLGQLAEDARALMQSCWKAASGSLPWVAARTPLACSTQTRLVNACRSWATSSSRAASSTLVWTSSPATAANSPTPSSSWAVQARGWVL
jgi:hypothetical protein